MTWWKFWERDKKPKVKLTGMALRMKNREAVTCECGFSYTANHTKCFNCGKPTVETLKEKDGNKEVH